MTPSRVVRFLSLLLLLVALPTLALAANTEFRVFFDVDSDATTGCSVGGFDGAEQVLVTQVSDDDTSPRVTRTYRQVCTNGALGALTDVVTTGWPSVFRAADRTMTLETRIPFAAFGSGTPESLHVGFDITRGAAVHAALVNIDGSPVIIPGAPHRRRAVGETPGRTITLDGGLLDWGNVKPVIAGIQGSGTTALRLLRVLSFASPSDSYIYFAAQMHIASDAPFAEDDEYLRQPGQDLTVAAGAGVLKNDGDPHGLPLTATKVSEASRGTVTLNPDGSFTYSPSNSASKGPDEFEYKATNGTSDSNVARVMIKIDLGETPHAPVDDSYSTKEDTNLTVDKPGVLDNDPKEEKLVAALFTAPTHGTVTLNADGGFTYKPKLNFFGIDTFVYTASKESNGNPVGNATVSITVESVNDAPNVQPATFTVQEHAPNGTTVGTVNVSDPDTTDDHTWSIIGGNTGGAFAINSSTGTITVANTSAINFAVQSTYSLSVRAQDNGTPSKSSTATITINVINVNDPPVAGNDAATVAEDGSVTVPPASGVLANDSDPDGDPMTAVLVATTPNGTLNLNPATGGFTYTPNPNFFGTDTFTYRASDGTNQSNLATVTITVTPVNDPPSFTAGPSPVTVNEDSGAYNNPWATAISAGPDETQNLTFNITNPNPALFAVQPAIDASGTLTFTPATNANGSVTLSITLSDDGTPVMTSGAASLTINITAVNDAPSFTAGPNQTVNEDAGGQTVNPWATAISPGPADEAGQSVTFNVSNDANSLFSVQPAVSASGVLTYTPAADANGVATVTVTLSDNGIPVATSGPQQFTITINGVNDAPVNSVPVAAQLTNEDTPITFTVSGGNGIQISDVDAGAGSLQVTLAVTNGTLTADTGAAIANNNTAAVTLTGTLTNINASLDGLIFTPTANYSGPAVLTITTNDQGNTGSGGAQQDVDIVNIIIASVNDQPVVNPATFSVDENSANGTAVGTATFTDADPADTHTFAITAGNTGGAFAINATTGAITVANQTALDFETTPTFSLTVAVTDNSGAGNATGSGTITVNLNNVNDAPVANDATFAIDENSANGTSVGTVTATDADAGQTLSYAITAGNTGGAFAINPTTGVITVADVTDLDFETNPTFVLTVTVTDNGTPNLNDTATITINLNNLNEAPVVDPATVSLDENSANGTAVHTVTFTEPDTTGQTHTFAITGGNTGGAFAINSTTGAITVANQTALDFETTPTFSLTVQVTDAGAPGPSLSGTAVITVNLNDLNENPVVNNQSFNVDENSANGTVVGTVVATDPDAGQTLTYSITAGNTLGAFAINSSTGQITTADVTDLDFETNPTFNLTVQVQDNGTGNLTDTATITINLNDVNEAPSIAGPGPVSIAENTANGTSVTTIVATDVDAGQTLSYSITAGNTGGAFAIGSNGVITVANSAALDFETTPSFTLTVQVTDNGTPNLSDTDTVTITITDVNEPPVVHPATFPLPENSPNGTSVGTVTFTDPDAGQTGTFAITGGNTGGAFTINPTTGEITVANSAALDFETNPTFSLTVTVTDNGPGNLTGSNTITINLTDANEPPVVNDQSFNVDENSSIGTVVGTVAFSDPDGPNDVFSITAGNGAGKFAINPSTGQIAVAGALDFETTTSYVLTVQIDDNGSPAGSDTAQVTINVNNVNEAPVVNAATVSLAENSPNGTAVHTVTFTDPDAGQTHTFAITAGNTGGAFTINSSTGAITVANQAAVDFETTPSFSLTVQVTDNGSPVQNGTNTITVNLSNVNDAPVVNDQTFAVPETASIGATVGTVVASDQDAGQTLTYSITAGNTGTAFAINSSTGQITVANTLNYETLATYSLTVQVQDNGAGNLTDTATITVNVQDVNEAPVANDASFNVNENASIGTAVGTVTATDADSGQTLTYAITAGNTGNVFAINSGTGAITVAGALDFETTPSYSLTVTVTDNGTPNLSDTATVTIAVNNVNEAPVVNPATVSLDENSANGTAVHTVTFTEPDTGSGQTHTFAITGGNTGGAFAINTTTGAITVANSTAVNYEATPSFSLTVQVTDNGVPPANGTATITVNLNNLNDPPVVANQTFAVNENSSIGTAVGTVAATEEDAGQTLTYAITAGNTGGAFAINASTGAITVAGPLNFEGPDDPYSLTVQVTDNAGVPASSTATITVNLNDVNEAPDLPDATRNINENSANGTNVGAVLPFTEPDAGQTHTFAITAGNTGGAFAVSNTGQITVANVAQLNYEVTTQFVLTVQITDNGTPNLSDTATVTVNINDVNEAPTAGPDAYNYIGNTELRVAGHAGTANALAFTTSATNPKANDTDPDGPSSGFANLSIVAAGPTTTPNNGVYRIETDGTLYYTPPAGYTGTDTITYQLTDGTNTVPGTITLTLTGTDVVWYVRNNDPTVDAFASNDGTSSDPFNTLVQAQTASGVNHIIYVHAGDGTTTGQNVGIVLKNNQKLWGQGVALTVNGATTLIAAGAQPQIGNAAGAGVTITNLSGIEVRGLNIGATTDAVVASLTAASSVTLEVAQNTIRAAGLQGINVDASAGTYSLAIHDNTITTTGNAIDIANSAAGAIAIRAFDDNVLPGAAGGGIVVNGVASVITFDAIAGGGIDPVAGGVTTIGTSIDRISSGGLTLTNVQGALSFTDLDVFTDAGNALAVDGGGTGFSFTVPITTGTLVANAGAAAILIDTVVDLQSVTLTSNNSAVEGVSLTNSTGTFSAVSASTITNATGTDFLISGGTVNSTYNGTITDDLGQLVSIANGTGGTKSFTGLISDGFDGDGNGISISGNNATTAISFSGGLSLATGNNAAFVATGLGTLTITDPAGATSNRISTLNGTALSVSGGVQIGAGNLVFESIAVDGNDTLPTNGILLNGTGSTGGLVVTSTGSGFTGGTIQDTGDDAISLTNTAKVSLTRMQITSNRGSGIFGSGVNGFVVADSSITVNGDDAAADESGILITDLTGTNGGAFPTSITNTTISNNWEFELSITNNGSGTLSNLTMSGNTISANGTQPNHGNLFNFLSFGTGPMTLNLTSGSFTGNTDTSGGKIITATALQCDHSGTAGMMTCNVSNATFTNNNVGPQGSVAANGQMTVDFNGNNIQGSRAHGVNIFADANAPYTKTIQGRIRNNTIGSAGTVDSGAATGFPIRVQNEGRVAVTLNIDNNDIFQSPNAGINLNHGISSANGTNASNLTVTNNNISNITASRAIIMNQNDIIGGGAHGTVCVDISANAFASIAGQAGDGTFMRLREGAQTGGTATFNIRQQAATAAANAAEIDDANGFNDPTKISVSGTPNFNAGTCTQPSN